MANSRITQEVFDHHLSLRTGHHVDQDITDDFNPDVVLLTSDGVFTGHQGVHQSASLLNERIPNARFTYTNKLISGDMAFLEWTGQNDNNQVCDGADSFLIRHGQIVVQTIHYTVRNK